jgi:hypothetical protein
MHTRWEWAVGVRGGWGGALLPVDQGAERFVCEPRSPRLPGAVTVPQAHHYLYDSTAFDAHIYGSGAPEVGSSTLSTRLSSPHEPPRGRCRAQQYACVITLRRPCIPSGSLVVFEKPFIYIYVYQADTHLVA